jgi:hypothetical protein
LSFKLRNGDILLLTWVILAAECLQNENLKGASPLKPNKTGSFCEHFYKKILTSQKAYIIYVLPYYALIDIILIYAYTIYKIRINLFLSVELITLII